MSKQIAINANPFASTFYFFSTHNATAEKNKKSLQANAPSSDDICASLTRHSNVRTEARTDNTGLAKVAVQCSTDTFVVKSPPSPSPKPLSAMAGEQKEHTKLGIILYLKNLFKPDTRKSKSWTMFDSSSEETSAMLKNDATYIFKENSIFISNYPFEPSISKTVNQIEANLIENIDLDYYPPAIKVKDELIFISQQQNEELKTFANNNKIKTIKREDIWGYILEPFLDTEVTNETNDRIYEKLSAFGLSKDEVNNIRSEVETQMLKYNFDTMLWEWCNLNAYDVLKAMRTKYNKEEYKEFYKRVMKIALLEKNE